MSRTNKECLVSPFFLGLANFYTFFVYDLTMETQLVILLIPLVRGGKKQSKAEPNCWTKMNQIAIEPNCSIQVMN